MRALLIVNPAATSTTPRALEVVIGALSHVVSAEVVMTGHRLHAMELARKAHAQRHDLVISVGGDGTLNEIVNGLLADEPGPDVPALGVIPGGSTNVFARNLGIPQDAVEATGALIDALRNGTRRHVGLGQADDRWFTFCAGFGLDAGVIRDVERRRQNGATASGLLYIRSALKEFYSGSTDRRRPAITLKVPGREPVRDIFLTVVTNSAPWTYLGTRAVNPSPEASFDSGLDVFGLTRLGTFRALRHSAQLLRPGGGVSGRDVVTLHDVPSMFLSADPALPFQVDGDYLDERSRVTLRAVPRAITVLA